jgi:hypothetical protein
LGRRAKKPTRALRDGRRGSVWGGGIGLPAEFEDAGPNESDVGELADDVQKLIGMEIGKAIALEEVDEPVADEFNGTEDRVGSDGPDETGMDQGVGGEAIDPDVGGQVEIGIFGNGDVTIFETGDEVALKREIAEGVTDEKGKEEEKSAMEGEGVAVYEDGRYDGGEGFHGWYCGGSCVADGGSVPGEGLGDGFLGSGDFLIGGAQAFAELGTDLDEEELAFGRVVVEKVLEHGTVDAPDLGEFDGGDGGAGFSGIENIDFAQHVTGAEGAQENTAAGGFGMNVQEAGDDEEEGILGISLFDDDGILMTGQELTIGSEETSLVVLHLRDNADIRQLGPGQVIGHVGAASEAYLETGRKRDEI